MRNPYTYNITENFDAHPGFKKALKIFYRMIKIYQNNNQISYSRHIEKYEVKLPHSSVKNIEKNINFTGGMLKK
jgi:hypothetical protein